MRKSTKRRPHRLFLVLLVCLALPCAALGLLWLITLPDVAALRTTNPATTALMDLRQEQAKASGMRFSRHWIWVPLSRMSPHLRRAVVAAEDAAFFTHEGFDWEGMKDAALYDLEQGALKRGGSTITQQLAKNLYLSSERSVLRKAQEALITRSLEQHLTKERILEIYLNVAEFGPNVFGVEAAADRYFHTSASALDLDQAALLAAVLPNPQRLLAAKPSDYVRERQAQIEREVRLLDARGHYRGIHW